MNPCVTCKHVEPHTGGGLGVCLYEGCGCDGPVDIVRLPGAFEREPSVQERTYQAAQIDPVAALILKAMHKQDANTYHGNSGDMGTLALNTAAQIRMLLSDGEA